MINKNEIKKISFTGSIEVGKLLAKKAADTLKRCTLELGGHSPVIIAEDANIEETIKTVGSYKFRNAGQVCISPTRFFVHEKIYNEVVDKFVDVAKNLKLGNGLDKETTMGPMAVPKELTPPARFNRCAPLAGSPSPIAKGFAAVCCREKPSPTINRAPRMYMNASDDPGSAVPTNCIIAAAPTVDKISP